MSNTLSHFCEYRTTPEVVRRRHIIMNKYKLWDSDSHWMRSAEMIALRFIDEHPHEFERRRKFLI